MSHLLGSRICGGNTAYKRSKSDFYPTPPDATQALLDFIRIPKGTLVWEPACGEGHMVRVLEENGMQVIGTDIQCGTDFLTADKPSAIQWIITNPPFSLAEQFIRRSAQHSVPFAMLLKAQYWNAKKRYPLFLELPPSYVLPLTWRPDFLFGERGCGSPLLDVMWCVWGMNFPGTLFQPLYRPERR